MLYCYSKAIAAVSKYLNNNPVGNRIVFDFDILKNLC
jgi:hypothetical protein